MFYYLMSPLLMYNVVLIAAAVIPAVFLMIKVYRSDRLEQESRGLLGRLVKVGILSSLLALVEERIAVWLLSEAVSAADPLYDVILYFVIVALAEESSKYLFMRRNTWYDPEFNCQFDGVVYAVFVSLGFALWENISYVLSYGFSTALVRAVTAIPGHACFGVFMGVFYGLAKRAWNRNEYGLSRGFRVLAVAVPLLLHGLYDYIASMEDGGISWIFIVFVAVMFAVSYYLVGRMSRTDRYI